MASRRPTLADNVVVEVLTAAQSEDEPSVGKDLHGGRLLRDDRRVIPHGRAGHVRVQIYPFGNLRHRAHHRPGVRCMSLGCQPR